MADEVVDVLIVGAGLSGIGAACHLQRHCPDRRFAIIEARDRLGGTWDLFRYPGVRSDSDMHTLGYSFRPWRGAKAIAEGEAILQYLEDTAREHGVDRQIRYRHRLTHAAWSTAEAQWTATVSRDGAEPLTVRARFLLMCGGYYDYAAGYQPDFPGLERFRGRVVHPQRWTDDIDWAGKRIVVIGSGATAVTLVPALAARAAHVTLLQRSPTYMVSRPSIDALEQRLRPLVGTGLAHSIVRWRNVLMQLYVFRLARRQPERLRKFLIRMVQGQLAPGYDVATHFTPRYNPWQQRLCLVPDGDLFRTVRDGRVEVVTDEIERFTETGIALKGGRTLAADLVVSATGLRMKLLDGVSLEVDGRTLQTADAVNYRGVMFAGVPNFATVAGYTSASWTLKADLVSRYVCRVLNHMRRKRARIVMPRPVDPAMPRLPWVDFTSGYFQRALADLPKQGPVAPWKLNQNYLADIVALRWRRLDDGVLQFEA